MRILIIEDDESICRTLESALLAEGFLVTTAGNGREGLATALSDPFDLILLDVMLPGIDGFSICRDVRSHGVQTPIIFLSARGDLDNKVTGLNAGADDYLSKPFELAELFARVKANLRRGALPSTTLICKPIVLDQISRTVSIDLRQIDLSPTEFALLEQLMQGNGRTVTRARIMQKVWKHEFYDDKVIDVYISALRKKLGDSGKMIRTDRGIGYRISGSGDQS